MSAIVASLVLVVVIAASPLLAAPLYSTSFNGTVGDLPTDWAILAGTAGNPGWRINPDGEYRFDESGTGLSHYTGSFSNNQAGSSFADGSIEATFRRGSNNVVGLVARLQDQNRFYHARLYGDALEIYRFGTGGPAPLGSASAPGYDAGESWTISMTLVGTTIRASVFDQLGNSVASVSATDSSFSSGTVGLRGTSVSVWEDFLVNAPVNLNVDIGASGAGNQIQTDFQSFAKAHGDYTTPEVQWLNSQLGNANRVRVELAAAPSGNQSGFRDRSDVTHAMGDLAEDFAFSATNSGLNLSLGSLLPGYYEIATYHHDQTSYINGTLDLSVSDARSNGRTAAQGVAITGGSTPTTIGSTTVSFHSDGVNPIVIHMDRNTANHALLNGFQLAPAAESLRVDFGLTGQDVQNGFHAFTRGTGTTGQQNETYTSGLGSTGSVTVSLAGAGNSLSWRDRGSSTAPQLPDVAEDFVFNLTYLELTLSGLDANQYLLTTYHHDLSHTGSDLEIAVWDAAGEGRVVEPALWQTSNQPTNDPALASFSIYADEDPVTIRFTNLATGTAPPIARLNGFSLTLVPEPRSLLLACIALLSLLLTGRRRRS